MKASKKKASKKKAKVKPVYEALGSIVTSSGSVVPSAKKAKKKK